MQPLATTSPLSKEKVTITKRMLYSPKFSLSTAKSRKNTIRLQKQAPARFFICNSMFPCYPCIFFFNVDSHVLYLNPDQH